MSIRFQSSVIFVKDIETSRRFYEGLLGQKVEMDHGENVAYQGGFSIWLRKHAEGIIHADGTALSARVIPCDHAELYFESEHLDEVLAALSTEGVEFVHPLTEQPWGQRVLRVFDPDGFMVEIGEPMQTVILRYHAQGMLPEDITLRTSMPLEIVRQTIAEYMG